MTVPGSQSGRILQTERVALLSPAQKPPNELGQAISKNICFRRTSTLKKLH